MKKQKLIKVTLLTFLFFSSFISSYAQFDKPMIQVGIGLAEPMQDTKGTYYSYYYLQSTGYQLLTVNPDLFTNNYGAKTGFSFFGNGKINFDKYGITRGVVGISFNTFNTFEPTKNGNVAQLFYLNGNVDTIGVPANFNYTFNNFSINLGIEVAPTSFTNKLSPYFGARVALNTFTSKLSWTTNGADTTTFQASDFRIGVMFDAGLEFKFSKTIGMVLGANYNLGNLLLKNTNSSFGDNHIWGKTNASINDAAGQFYSTLYNPVMNGINYPVQAKQKNINWASFYLGVNIYLNTGKTSPKSPNKKYLNF
jgi:hypothetical protein